MERNKVINEINMIIGRMIHCLDEEQDRDKISALSEARSRIISYLNSADFWDDEIIEEGKFQHRWHNYDGNI